MGTNTMYVHRMGHAASTYTHTVANIIPVYKHGAHYTHTYKLMYIACKV